MRFFDTAELAVVLVSSISLTTFHWSLATVLPPHAPRFSLDVSGRKLASFAGSIPPRFVLSCNPQSTNSGANWLRSGAHSTLLLWPSSPSLEFHWPLATVLPLHAVRLTAHTEPAGSGRCKTLPRWVLPLTDSRIVNERTGPDLDERTFYIKYVTEPGDSSGQSQNRESSTDFDRASTVTGRDHGRHTGEASKLGRKADSIEISSAVTDLTV